VSFCTLIQVKKDNILKKYFLEIETSGTKYTSRIEIFSCIDAQEIV